MVPTGSSSRQIRTRPSSSASSPFCCQRSRVRVRRRCMARKAPDSSVLSRSVRQRSSRGMSSCWTGRRRMDLSGMLIDGGSETDLEDDLGAERLRALGALVLHLGVTEGETLAADLEPEALQDVASLVEVLPPHVRDDLLALRGLDHGQPDGRALGHALALCLRVLLDHRVGLRKAGGEVLVLPLDLEALALQQLLGLVEVL